MIYTTEQAAQRVEISYITLRRWLAAGKFKPSLAIPASGRMLWGWTDADIKMLQRFKHETYWKVEWRSSKKRGRKPRRK